jgi:hypothetical protein
MPLTMVPPMVFKGFIYRVSDSFFWRFFG